MPKLSCKTTKVWQVPCLDNLELFRAKAIHHSYARHSHATYSIGVIESGIGGNYYRGATHVAEPYSIIFMNPDEVHTGYCVDNLPLTYRMLYPSTGLLQNLTNDLGAKIPFFPETVVHDKNLARKIQNLHCILETSQNALERDTLFVEVLSLAIARYADIKVNLTQIKQELAVIRLIKDYL